jgi:ATP-dependent RNA helicase RhlE
MKIIQIKVPKKEESGPAFHEKSLKNQKVNVRKNHKDAMKKKYGKPKKRKAKK